MANKKNILIIDDDPDILDSIQVILEKNGYATTTAKSGKDGIEAAVKSKPDLILCDMMMETIDSGARAAQEIKKSVPGIPILLMSSIGSATASNVEIDKLGFNGFLQKPVEPDGLVTIVKNALR